MATPYVYDVNGKKFTSDEPLTPDELEELKSKVGGASLPPAAPAPAPAPAPKAAEPYVYNIGGKDFVSDEPLSPEELEELKVKATQVAKPSEEAPPASGEAQEPAGFFEYLANAARRGITGTTSLAGAAYETAAEMNRKLEEMAERARREKMTMEERIQMFRESDYYPSLANLVEKYGEQQRKAGQVTGARDLTAPGPVTEILGSGVEAMTDPVGLAGKLKPLLTAGRAAGEFITGAVADVGGRTGTAIEKAVTGEESGIGQLTGSLLAGGASAAKRETGSQLFKDALEKYRQVKLRASSDEAAEDYAKGAAKRLLEFAAKEQGAGSIQEIIKEAAEAAKFSTGKPAPLLVALADNPVIRQQVIRLAKTDPAFRQQVNDTLASLSGDMRNKVEKIFGVRYEATGEGRSIFDPGYVAGKEKPAGLDIGSVAKRREVLSQRIENIASGFEPEKSKDEIGSRIESLIEDKKKLARQEVSPEYDALLREARNSGVQMPAEGVGTIYEFVRDNNLRDIFGKGTELDRRIMGLLGPKEFDETIDYLPMSFDNVESLKRAINELKRKRMSEDSMRKVMQLEEIVDEARKTIPGDFSNRLNAIDLKYYEKVGVPFGAQGVKDIDSKKYATQVAPVIVKNSESFDQFIRAVGKDDGYKIAEDSIISEIYDKAIKNGELNPGALAKYIKQKEKIIRQIPGLEDKLRTALADDSALRARISQLDDAAAVAQKRIADNALTKFEAPNYNALARSFMSDPKSREKLLRDIGDLDADSARAVRRTLRAEIINLADNNPSGFMDYLMDPANKDALDKAFGSAFQPSLRKVGLLADKLAKADVSKVGVSVTKEDLDPLAQLAPGLDIPYINSTFRDRITSLPQKVVRLMSRVNDAKLLKKTDETIKELLLDPNGAQKLANVASSIDFSVDIAGNLKKLSGTLADVMPRAFYTSGKTSIAGQEREQRAKERQQQLSEDIITGEFAENPEITSNENQYDIDSIISSRGAENLAPLIRSIYEQESSSGRADTSRENYAGAKGPMQVTRDTFEGMRAAGMIPEDYSFDNQSHLAEAGVALIQDLARRYGNDPEKIAAAYYGGPAAVTEGGIRRTRRDPKNPKAPTVGEYADQVLSRLIPEAQAAGMARGGPVRYSPQEEALLRKYARGGTVSNPTVPSEEPEGEEKGRVARFLEAAAQELPSAMLENVRGYSDLASKYLTWKFGGMPVEDQVAFARSLPSALREAAVNAIQSAKELPEKIRTATPESAGAFTGELLAGELTDPMRVGRAARAVTKPVVSKITEPPSSFEDLWHGSSKPEFERFDPNVKGEFTGRGALGPGHYIGEKGYAEGFAGRGIPNYEPPPGGSLTQWKPNIKKSLYFDDEGFTPNTPRANAANRKAFEAVKKVDPELAYRVFKFKGDRVVAIHHDKLVYDADGKPRLNQDDFIRAMDIAGIDSVVDLVPGKGIHQVMVRDPENLKRVDLRDASAPTMKRIDGNQFPVVKAGDVVDGLKVRPETANVSSIKASLENYSVMPGIRSVSIDDFGEPGPLTGNVDKLDKRTRELADAISQSNEITPLIVVYSGSKNYILEGSHRIDALDALGKKKIPVIAVIDEDDPPAFWKGKR